MDAAVSAKHAVFENCVFYKNGKWYKKAGYSSKWIFDSCILHECVHPAALNKTGYGFRWINCSITFMNLPRVTPPFRNTWHHVYRCNFIGCNVPPSFGWNAQESNFYNCTMRAGDVYNGTEEIEPRPFLKNAKGESPLTTWTRARADKPAPKLTPALKPYDVYQFPVRLPLAALKKDASIAPLLFR